MQKIILTGYMASGKTTIGKLLSQASGLDYIDLDEYIERKTGNTIPELFRVGEIKFRKLEHESLKEIMDTRNSFILSLGGGTPCYANNHEFLKQDDVLSVYLKTGIDEIISRINVQKDNIRPMLDNLKGEELREFVAKHLFDRSYFYMQAKHVVVTDNKTPEQVVNQIMSLF